MHSLFLPLYYKINTYTTNICDTFHVKLICIVCMKGISRSVPCYLNLAQISYLELKLAESVAGKKLNSSFFKHASIFTFFVYWHCAILKILQQFCKVQGQPIWWYIWMVYAVWTYSFKLTFCQHKVSKPADHSYQIPVP